MTTAITVTTQHVNAGDYALCHATTNDERLVADVATVRQACQLATDAGELPSHLAQLLCLRG